MAEAIIALLLSRNSFDSIPYRPPAPLPGSVALSLLALQACTHASWRGSAAPDPRVTAPTLKAAAVACASRGFSYVAHVDGGRYYCLSTNPLNEPEAVAVSTLIERAP